MISLRIATWNIGGGFISDNDANHFDNENIDYFVSKLKEIDSDIVCLQEIHLPINPALPDQSAFLSSSLNLPFREVHPSDSDQVSHLKSDQFLAIALLSRHPVINSQYLSLPNPNLTVISTKGNQWLSHNKGFLKVTLKVGKTIFNVVTGHNVPFHLFKRDFMEPDFTHIRRELEDFILASAQEHPTIVAGDMNYERVEQLLPKVFAHGFSRSLPNARTEPIRNTQIDHILVSKEWQVIESGVIEGLADHFLCYVGLYL